MGDAAATAHFSVGSGTKLALESAIALAEYLHTEPTLPAAFARYEEERRTEVLRLQSAARNSTEWFEQVERYLHLDPVQFNYSLLTRSQRISHENLRLRDKAWLESAEMWFEEQATREKPQPLAPADVHAVPPARPATEESHRRVADGSVPRGRRHADRLASRALRRARQGRRRAGHHRDDLRVAGGPHLARLHRSLRARTRSRRGSGIVDFVHAETDAKIGLQLGHSGPKGSTQLGWEERGRAAAGGQLAGHRSVAGRLVAAQPGAARDDPRRHGPGAGRVRAGGDDGRARRLRHARAALRARLSAVGLHLAADQPPHRRLRRVARESHALSARGLSRRAGGVAGAQCRFRCASRPTTGWATRAITPEDAVAIARLLGEAGVDIIDVSAGQTSRRAQPVYGRMFQTPFSDRIRNETGIATMAVGNIYEPDHVNSILMAGRADLCCLARPHLADPYWTLHAAAKLGYRGETWPKPYLAGRDQLYRLASRADASNV